MKQEGRFAAFIMTFERPEVLKETLSRILAQTFPPAYVLIVDNSYSSSTKKYFNDSDDERIGYHHMGSNTGPAGAARFGLQKLSGLGFEWIYWGDDDNPPSRSTTFGNFFSNLDKLEKDVGIPGIFGGKGGYLNRNTGRVRSLANHELKRSRFLEVDSVPGGHTLIVNSQLVKAGVLPDEKLFFGFEELDFCLKAREKGFKIIIDAKSWLEVRRKANNNDPHYQWKNSTFGKKEFLSRDYFSSRNLLVILYSRKYYRALTVRFVLIFMKSFVGFKFGLDYGFRNLKVQWQALFDFLTGRFPSKHEKFSNTRIHNF